MTDKATYISLHSIHTYPYANLNRDDLGTPKSLLMGGVNRIRISSQCLKRSMRRWAEDEGHMTASIRTREITNLIKNRLDDGGTLAEADREEAAAIVGGLVDQLSGKGDPVVAFFGQSEVDRLVDLAAGLEGAGSFTKADTKKHKDAHNSDVELALSRAESGVALFGRMFAETPKVSVDGAVQMAHAFTVHEASPELDWFNAVEDWVAERSHSGAGHLNTNEFSTGTFYKYANIGLAELRDNVSGDAESVQSLVGAFVRSFVLADPSGKQTSTAARTLPDLVYVAVESRRPVSLASAYDAPVRSRDGYRQAAAERLNAEASAVASFLGAPIDSAHAGLIAGELPGLGGRVATIDELVALATRAAN